MPRKLSPGPRGENGEGEENSGTPILPFPSLPRAVLCCAVLKSDGTLSPSFFLSFFLSFLCCVLVFHLFPSFTLLSLPSPSLRLPLSLSLSLSLYYCVPSLCGLSLSLSTSSSVFFISSLIPFSTTFSLLLPHLFPLYIRSSIHLLSSLIPLLFFPFPCVSLHPLHPSYRARGPLILHQSGSGCPSLSFPFSLSSSPLSFVTLSHTIHLSRSHFSLCHTHTYTHTHSDTHILSLSLSLFLSLSSLSHYIPSTHVLVIPPSAPWCPDDITVRAALHCA